MTYLILTAGFIAAAMLVMAIGVIFSRRCLRGSCGGPDVVGPDGESLRCVTCPHRDEESAEAVADPS